MSAGLVIIISCRPAMLYSTAGDTLHLNKASVNWTVRRYWAGGCGLRRPVHLRLAKGAQKLKVPKTLPRLLDIFDFPAGRIGRLCAQREPRRMQARGGDIADDLPMSGLHG